MFEEYLPYADFTDYADKVIRNWKRGLLSADDVFAILFDNEWTGHPSKRTKAIIKMVNDGFDASVIEKFKRDGIVYDLPEKVLKDEIFMENMKRHLETIHNNGGFVYYVDYDLPEDPMYPSEVGAINFWSIEY